jgi:uroporphyrinogen decarboxylase
MSRRERLLAAVRREPVDRVPYAVWRHFPAVDGSPAGLAQATLRFHERYGSDFVKLTPRSGYAVAAWGCVEAAEPGPGGNRPCARCAIETAGDWARIRPLDPASAEGWSDQLEAIIRMGFDRRIGDAPVLPTVFSPLSLARRLSRGRLVPDLKEHPRRVTAALEAITDTVVRFVDQALAEGASGIFYAIQVATRTLLAEEDYARFGEPYDRQVLESIRGRALFTVIHGHGDRLMLDRLGRLPADAWSWDDRLAGPPLGEGQALVPGAVVGGLDQWRTLREGTPEEAAAEAQDAIARTGGLGIVVAPGCVLAMNTPDETLAAVVRALGGPLRPIPASSADLEARQR